MHQTQANRPAGRLIVRPTSVHLFARLIFTTTLRLYPFTSKRFHALLNSLFKVLFNFPSRYLFTIGLVVIFSLRWSLPPTLGCTLKQPDSIESHTASLVIVTGLPPSTGSQSRELTIITPTERLSLTLQVPRRSQGIQRWALSCSLAVTKEILVSFFSSA